MPRRFRFSISLRIYTIIGLSFCGLIGLAVVQAGNLAASLKEQRQSELRHLAEVAVGIAREEYDIAVRDHSSDDLARKTAAARISKLRYGNGDYFWINDLAPRMIMHPAKPELNGQDLADIMADSAIALTVDGIAARLQGVVGRKDKSSTLLKFDPSGDAAKFIRDLAERREVA